MLWAFPTSQTMLGVGSNCIRHYSNSSENCESRIYIVISSFIVEVESHLNMDFTKSSIFYRLSCINVELGTLPTFKFLSTSEWGVYGISMWHYCVRFQLHKQFWHWNGSHGKCSRLFITYESQSILLQVLETKLNTTWSMTWSNVFWNPLLSINGVERDNLLNPFPPHNLGEWHIHGKIYVTMLWALPTPQAILGHSSNHSNEHCEDCCFIFGIKVESHYNELVNPFPPLQL